MSSVEGSPAPTASGSARKLGFFSSIYFWIPVATTAVSLVLAAVIFHFATPVFVSYGSMWETEKLRLPDGATFTDDRDQYLGTQAGLLRSQTLRALTLNRMKNVGTNEIILDKAGNPLAVDINVYGLTNSSLFVVEARSANSAFTSAFLDALMKQYLEYRKNVRRYVSGDTLASLAEQVQRLERDMQAGQAAWNDYQKSNNLAVLQLQATIAADCLAKLNNQLSSLQLDDIPFNHPALSGIESTQHQTLQLKMEFIRNAIKEWEAKVTDASAQLAFADDLKKQAFRNQGMYERLSQLLQNIDISQNINQDTMAILEPASPAIRSFAREKRRLMITGCVGFGIGLGISLLLRRARQTA